MCQRNIMCHFNRLTLAISYELLVINCWLTTINCSLYTNILNIYYLYYICTLQVYIQHVFSMKTSFDFAHATLLMLLADFAFFYFRESWMGFDLFVAYSYLVWSRKWPAAKALSICIFDETLDDKTSTFETGKGKSQLLLFLLLHEK